MDMATFLGLVTGLAMIFAAMFSAGDNPSWLHLPSLFITIGGTLSAVLIHFPAKRVRTSFAVARKCFVTTLPEASEVVNRFRAIATQVRRQGPQVLEQEAAKETDSFMKLGLDMAANESESTFVREALQRELAAIEHRHLQGRRLFEVMASAAPAWSGPAVPLLTYCVMAASWSAIPEGWVSQPTRQPVIAHALEKLLTERTRSPSSAICRIEGALSPSR